MAQEKPRGKRWLPLLGTFAVEFIIVEFVVHGLHLKGDGQTWAILIPVLITFYLYIRWIEGD